MRRAKWRKSEEKHWVVAAEADPVASPGRSSCGRVFAIDVLECSRYGGAMKILSALHPPETTTAILACLGLPTRAPPTEPARAEAGAGPTDTAAADW